METMALKGKPRDMNKWREVLLDPNVQLPRRVERIPERTQRAVGGGGRAPAAERAGRRPAPGTPSGRPHQGGLRLRVRGRWQQGEVLGVVRTGQELAGHLQHDVPALVGRPTSGSPRGQDSRAAAYRAPVPVM